MRCSALPIVSKCRGSYKLTEGHGSIHSRLGQAFHELARAKVLNLPNPVDSVRIRYALTDKELKDLDYGVYNITLNLPEGAWIIADDKQLVSANGKLTGHPDLAVYHARILTLADWKSGWGDVEGPETNNQLIGGAGLAVELLESQGKQVDRIDLLLIQPRLNQIKAFTMTPAQLKEAMKDILRIIEEAESDKAELTTGPWCAACFKSMHCPAFAGEIKKLATFIAPTEIKDLQRALQVTLPFAKACGTVCRKIDDLAKAWVDQNGSLELGDGQRFVRVISGEKKLDPEKALAILKEYLPGESVYSVFSGSITKVKEACAKVKRGLSTIVINRLTEEKAITEEPAIKYKVVKGGENGTGAD